MATKKVDPQEEVKNAALGKTKPKAKKAVARKLAKKEEKFDPNVRVPKEVEEVRFLSKAKIMERKLANQPTVRFFIPTQNKEKAGLAREHVQINGHIVQYEGKPGIPKGVFVDIPQQVAEILQESMNMPSGIAQRLNLDNNPDADDRLN